MRIKYEIPLSAPPNPADNLEFTISQVLGPIIYYILYTQCIMCVLLCVQQQWYDIIFTYAWSILFSVRQVPNTYIMWNKLRGFTTQLVMKQWPREIGIPYHAVTGLRYIGIYMYSKVILIIIFFLNFNYWVTSKICSTIKKNFCKVSWKLVNFKIALKQVKVRKRAIFSLFTITA